nr:MAG TPA_asm: hypothetical protein [Caudoviricetes sp.]
MRRKAYWELFLASLSASFWLVPHLSTSFQRTMGEAISPTSP